MEAAPDEPEPEPGEGVPPAAVVDEQPAVEMDLATFLAGRATEDAPPSLAVSFDGEAFGTALRTGFASLYAAVAKGGTLADGCDVSAQAGDATFCCHSLVLTVWSAVFRTSLEERWGSAAADGRAVLTIELGPATPADFEALLRYCYTGELLLTASSVVGLLHLSNYYGVDPIKTSCGEFLFSLLGNEQLPALLAIAEEYNVAHLRRACACALADDFEDLLEQGTLWSLSVEVWAELLQQTQLAVSDETTVLDAVLELASPPHSEDAAARARVLQQLLPCVRLPQLGERLISVQQDAELMSVPGMAELVIDAFKKLGKFSLRTFCRRL